MSTVAVAAPSVSIQISRNKGIPAIAAENIPQTDRLESTPVSPEVTSLVPLSSKKGCLQIGVQLGPCCNQDLGWSSSKILICVPWFRFQTEDRKNRATAAPAAVGQRRATMDGRRGRTDREGSGISSPLSHLRRMASLARFGLGVSGCSLADAPPLSPSLRPPIPIRL